MYTQFPHTSDPTGGQAVERDVTSICAPMFSQAREFNETGYLCLFTAQTAADIL